MVSYCPVSTTDSFHNDNVAKVLCSRVSSFLVRQREIVHDSSVGNDDLPN